MPFSGSRLEEKENVAEEPSTIVYLGENASYLPDSQLIQLGSNGSSLKGAPRPIQRSVSNGIALSTPLMIGMPRSRSYIELGDSLEDIPHFSWIFPYIIACSPPEFVQLLRNTPPLFITLPSNVNNETTSRNSKLTHHNRVSPMHANLKVNLFSESQNWLSPKISHVSGSYNNYQTLKGSVTSAALNILSIDSAGSIFADDLSTPTRRNSGVTGISFPRSSSPPAISHIDLPSTWRSLGTVRVFNMSWKKWESRMLYLLDNFLLECDNDIGDTILGFAPLSSAIIERVPLHDLKGHYGAPYSLSETAQASSKSESCTAALKVSVYKSTFNRGGDMLTFWLSLESIADLNILEAVLLTASNLTLDDIYIPAATKSLIGTGRYNEVHITRKRANRPLIMEEYLKPRDLIAKQHGSILNRFRSDSADSIDSLDRVYHEGREGLDEDHEYPDSETVQEAVGKPAATGDTGEEMQPRDSDGSTSSEESPGILRDVPSDPPSPSDGSPIATASQFDLLKGIAYSEPSPSQTEKELCAVKCISTKRFWMRVGNIQERADTLVREVLAQVLLSSHFLSPNSLSKLRDNIWSQYAKSSISLGNQDGPMLTSIINEESGELPIVQLFGVFETMDDFSLELELMESIDLQEHINELVDEGHPGYLEEVNVRQIISQLVDAVSLCNRIGIAHRDIKLPNIMLPRNCERYSAAYKSMKAASSSSKTGQDKDDLVDEPYFAVKLADFGMAGFVCADRKIKGRCGTPGYIAPDIMRSDKKEGYSLNVDMFSVGVVAYTLLCGEEPFCEDGIYDIMEKNRQAKYDFNAPRWEEVSNDAKMFIARALESRAEDRINAEESKRHPWLRDFFFNRCTGKKSAVERTRSEEGRGETLFPSSPLPQSSENNQLDNTILVAKVLPYSRETSVESDTTVVPSIEHKECVYVQDCFRPNYNNKCSIA